MLNRSLVVDENFIKRLKSQELPDYAFVSNLPPDIKTIFKSQVLSRLLDLKARELKLQNKAFYTIGSSGHEGNAAIASAFKLDDVGFLHYRSCAFMLQRAFMAKLEDPVYDHLLAIVASKECPISSGRHKVFGSLKLNVPPQTSTISSHIHKAVGMAYSISLSKEYSIENKFDKNSVVLCSFGDASVNHSSFQGAYNLARRISYDHIPLPIVFICEDNGIGISTPSPLDYIKNIYSNDKVVEYISCNGLDLTDVYSKAKLAENIARVKKKPVFLHLKTVRLLGHAGSDIESKYKTLEQIEESERHDPLLYSARLLIDNKLMNAEEILSFYNEMKLLIDSYSEKALKLPKLNSAKEIMKDIVPPVLNKKLPELPSDEIRKSIFKENFKELNQLKTMSNLINYSLTDLMIQFENIAVFGEDVGKLGGVYTVTNKLQERFKKTRVFDTLLDEQSILGIAIGMAQNGFLPICEIQFMAYLHNAADQLRGEAATLSFFSSGQFTNPMIIRLPGFAYQKGFGGHFHNDNAFAFIREIPGVIICCPSNGVDAVLLLRECVRLSYIEQRVIVFIEPIALYMTKDLYDKGDNGWLGVYPSFENKLTFGEFGIITFDDEADIVIISYANGYYLSKRAAKVLLDKFKVKVKLIDLRWLSPINYSNLIEEISDIKNVLIVDESRKTGSLAEEIICNLYERNCKANIKRINSLDSFIPLGNAFEHVLPSMQNIIDCALDMTK